MGLLVDGQWQDNWYDTESSGGRFEREDAGFRNWVTVDGSAGSSGRGGFQAEANRYHLYVSLACPWANRTTIFRQLKGLEDIISMSVVHPFMGNKGWTFAEGTGVIVDPIIHASYLYEVYIAAKPNYTGRVTIPILWDKKTNTIVSNESAEIIRMFNSAFNGVGAVAGDFLPADAIVEIDEINAFIYDAINNGVYKAGFASTQAAYTEAVVALFDALDTLEARLADQRYLIGSTITEADWRLFTTLVRFDAVYVGHFKCNIRRIIDYPNLWGYLRDLYQVPGIKDTVDMDHIKAHYYTSHATINPTAIVPVGPLIDFDEPHERAHL
ncbi:glutathione S-transferase family protein [Psychrobacter sp. LV10R520-6]|uniref:glutathione S-transferase family protein n=1 Tax=Psychrobacter sp. LV10R520-6 TaxID=1415574 RepID=UPI0024C8E9C0|nr:glutathione S-transferase family protein [Psychrobacter sp. LV10R520-6]SNT71084.1 putative glutathione S-transferase [Psychrobacter sp. LV10R520-6]